MVLQKLVLIMFSLLLIFMAGCESCCPDARERAARCPEGRVDPCNPCIVGDIVPPYCPGTPLCLVEFCKEPLICTVEDRNRTIAYLIRNHVKVIHVGETITLVLPSDYVFNTRSANFNPNYLPVLKAVSHLIFCYEKVTTKVGAYTDTCCSCCSAKLLTEAQAQAVARQLWCNGIDTRLLVASGYGSNCPIASNNTSIGQCMNRRIEICFRYIPPWTPGC